MAERCASPPPHPESAILIGTVADFLASERTAESSVPQSSETKKSHPRIDS